MTLGGRGHNRLLKILHIDPERRWGGGEAQVLGLLSHLAAAGHRNDLLTFPRGKLWDRCRGLDIVTLPLVARNAIDLRSVWRLRRLIRRERYDIVHLHTKRAHVLSAWLPHGEGAPKYVVTRRMDYPEKKNRYIRYLYNRCVDGVVAISQPIVDLLLDAGVDAGKIRLIHSGIDIARFDVRPGGGAANRVPAIGTAAVLQERKGHRFLLEAVAQLKARGMNLRCLLAGEGSERQALEEMVTRLGLEREVKFLGFVADTPSFLADIDIFVLPSLHEGLGVAALEAMAAGKAVVASQVGGLAELITDGLTGFLVPPRDSKALSDAIARLFIDPNLMRAAGQRAAEHVRGYFTVQRMAKQNETYYYELLEARA
jgi:glycosyltransferase involved in cell wall biosynthesis